jgi:DNA-binding transcriptional ArsR family regulator
VTEPSQQEPVRRTHRRITDPETLKGLAHPLRRKLLDQLTHFGPATVSVLAERLAADPGQMSYHLRELGRRGFIEEAPELARDRRERCWRAVPGSVGWSGGDFTEPADRAVADTVLQQMIADQFERLAAYNATRESWPAEWSEAAAASANHLRLTADELRELSAELNGVLRRWAEVGRRARDARPDELPQDGREHVFLFFHAFPEKP